MIRSIPTGFRFAVVLVAAALTIGNVSAQTLTTLAEFDVSNGAYPYGALIQGADGNLYGTTYQGGSHGVGTVFQVTTNGTLTTITAFDLSSDFHPRCALVQGDDGDFYGTAPDGGEGYGTVFKLTSGGELTTLVSFNSENGATPYAGLTRGPDENFYGTTHNGGLYDAGTIFKMTPAGVLTTLKHFFPTSGGRSPYASLIVGTNNLLYGTAESGGTTDDGIVFQIATNGTLYKQLASLSFDSRGSSPEGALVQHSDGNFYGTTYTGGPFTAGTIFKINSAGTLTTVFSFSGANGANPYAGLVAGNDGNFYGTTSAGGSARAGSLFRMTPAGVLTTLVSFTGTNGARPYSALVRGKDGYFYGTTAEGGALNKGTIFRLNATPLPPTITAHPQSRSVLIGSSVSFSATAASLAPMAFQWQKNESDIFGATNSNLSLTGVSTSEAGTYRLLVSNSSGWTPSSNATLTVYLPPPPAAPSNLSATSLNSTAISLRWTNNATNVGGFIIWRGATSNLVAQQVGTVAGTARAFTNSGLAASTPYFYTVQATNFGGASEKSAVASAQTLPAPPSAPANLSATVLGSSAVSLRWTASTTNINTFLIWRGLSSNSTTLRVGVLPGTARAFTNSGLAASTTYFYTVQATNLGGASAKSTAISTKTFPATPKAPGALALTVMGSSAISIRWTNNPVNPDAFIIWRGPTFRSTPLKIATVPGTARGFTNSGLAGDTYYFYSVQATNLGGASVKAGPVGARTLAVPPSAPTTVTASALAPNRVSISWKKTGTNAAGFSVCRGMSSTGSFVAITNVSVTVSNWIDSTVHSGLTYYYSVSAYNTGGSATNTSPVRVVLPVGLTDNLIWQNTNGQFVLWLMNQTNFVRYAYLTNGPAAKTGWRVAAFADLNSDYNSDILWQNTNGQLMTWLMKGTNLLRSALLRSGPAATTGWKVASAPDLTGDGKADFLWLKTTGATMLWQMNGTNYVKEFLLRSGQPASTGWGIAGTTDLNGISGTDIIWSNTNGMNAVWWMNRTNYITNAVLRTGYTAASGWKLSGLADMNADRKTDFIWEKKDGKLESWLMNGSNYLRSVTLRTNTAALSGWKLVGPK